METSARLGRLPRRAVRAEPHDVESVGRGCEPLFGRTTHRHVHQAFGIRVRTQVADESAGRTHEVVVMRLGAQSIAELCAVMRQRVDHTLVGNLASCLMDCGELAEAEQVIDRALELEPGDEINRSIRGRITALRGREK